jgi:hypothetical protein
LDFDQYGQGFISNSVTPHLYHVIMGAHVERRRASPNSRYAYGVIDTIADHKHYAGGDWTKSRTGAESLGGGHAHCGLMVYQGDNWPEKYRGSVFMNNIHGDRMNNDLLKRAGSGYVAGHGADFLTCADPWYMALHVKYGPDGAVYVSDWYDTGECHTRKPKTENGRIYKISYGEPRRLPPFDVSKMDTPEVVKLLLHPNEWWARRARREMQERAGGLGPNGLMEAIVRTETDVTRRLRGLWGLHCARGATEPYLAKLLKDREEWMRAWAVQLLAEDRNVSPQVLAEFERLAADDPSPVVRLFLVSAMTRLPLEMRWGVLQKLVAHAEDVADQNLPLMYWYALEPMVVTDARRALALAMQSKMPKLREYVARRMAEGSKKPRNE